MIGTENTSCALSSEKYEVLAVLRVLTILLRGGKL
jgi:hypothetical protein